MPELISLKPKNRIDILFKYSFFIFCDIFYKSLEFNQSEFLTEMGNKSNSPAPWTSEWFDIICSIKLVPDLGMPRIKIGIIVAIEISIVRHR